MPGGADAGPGMGLAAPAMAQGEAGERNIWAPFEAMTPENLADYR